METAEEVKVINEKIMYHNNMEDVATKIVKSKSCSVEMELKLLWLEKHLK